ncbi:CapA family protein [uncultured Cellulomonas sp.]|uniref:CapA family protein n=1 Tax=uncultured Cellulomonas sp. TaxID=189682 RepID=UPI00261131E3|nr:CapA family protein [uncultured Cellulomonas sp.]
MSPADAARTHPGTVRRAVVVGVVLVLLAVVALGIVVATVWRTDDAGVPGQAEAPPSVTRTDTPSPTPSPTPTTPPDATFTIVAAGDVLPHLSVLASARTEQGYDFGPLLAPLDAWVQAADLALCHLEVPVVPDGSTPSGYPAFGAPRELTGDLARHGWDGCSTASNHSLDRGREGLVTTLDALDAAGLGHVGTARTQAEAQQPQLYRLERAGHTLTVAHVAATYGLNGLPLPPDAPWSVTLLDPQVLVAQATAARQAGADLVIASVHCCVEYVTAPSGEQVEVAQALADSGVVDLVLGHHAHVPQPVVHLEGGPRGEGMWVFHGLGNLLSNQDGECCPPATSSGLLGWADVVTSADGPARITGVGWTGVTVDRGTDHHVHALPDVPDGTGTLDAAEIAARAQRVAEAAGPQAPQRTRPPVPTGPPPEVVARVG